jgi:CheY-like chemotaxis protein
MPFTVLLADDDKLARRLLRAQLEDEGFRVVEEAGDGYSAIAIAAAVEPDFVILDQMMPMLDGTDALAAIAAASPLSQVIVHTALDAPDFQDHARRAGAVAVIHKLQPFADLLDLLRSLEAPRR